MKKNIFVIMAAIMILCLSTTVMAADNIYLFKLNNGKEYEWPVTSDMYDYSYAVMFGSGTYYTVVLADVPIYLDTSDRNYLKLSDESTYLKYSYMLSNGVWKQYYDGGSDTPRPKGFIVTQSQAVPVWANYYVEDQNGNSVIVADGNFRTPLTLEEAKAEGLAQMIQTVKGAFLILVGLGIGCLALLICLPMLKKVLLRFLPN